MFPLSGVQPQLSQALMPLTQVASLVNSMRSVGQNACVRQHYSSHNRVTAVAAPPEDVLPEITDTVFATMAELGFKDLDPQLTAEMLSPLLRCMKCEAKQQSQRKTPRRSSSFVSAETFFENKHGLTERELWESTFGDRPLQRFQQSLPNLGTKTQFLQWLHSPNYQQKRGFKTNRRAIGVGRGTIEDRTSPLRQLKESVMDRISGTTKPKQTSQMKKIVGEYEHSPEVQNKMKIAFAEGYTAHEKKESDHTGVWPKRILRFVWYGFLIWIALQLIQGYSAIGGNMKINVLKGENHEVNPEEIKVTFDDVKGVDEAKQELKDVVEFLKDPDKFKALGAKLPKGVLLVGPPGIGKTLLARAVAGEAGVPFFSASGSEFDEIFVGTGAKRVRQLFDAAKIRAPCVIFIDEIDTVGAKRTSSQIHPYANQTINQLLSEMDGFQQNEGVIVLGATNRRDNLDKALLRPGRFDVEVRVFPPDVKGRKDILEHYLSKVKIGNDIDLDKLARGTTGLTGADLENLVNQATLKAAMDGAADVTMSHMEFAKDKILMGPAKKNKISDDETNLMTAYHEAGHTIVAYYTKDATPLHKVTIIPRGMSLGHTSFVPEKEQYNQSKAQLLAMMDVSMGGRVAEEVIYGGDKVTTGASNDFQNATAIATAMVKHYGMSEKVGVRVFNGEAIDSGLSFLKINEVSPAITELVDNEIKRLLQESYERARLILKNHAAEHKALADALMKYETLDSEEIKMIIEGKKLTKKL